MSLSGSAMGLVFSAFTLGYALAQIPSGWFADKAGPRIALTIVVGAWSALTALTGAAWNLTSLVAIRFRFGIGEAGAFPCSARAIVWFRDCPEGRKSAGEADAPASVSLSTIFRSRGMALAMAQYLSASTAAAYAMLPLLLGAVSQWLNGWLVDAIYHSEWHAWSRRLPAMLGSIIEALGLLVLKQAKSAEAAIACFTLAALGADMTISPSWVFCSDIAGSKAGSVSGAMNISGLFVWYRMKSVENEVLIS